MKKLFILLIACCGISVFAVSQNAAFCKAVENGNFKKAERMFKKQVQKRKNGTVYYNDPGSGCQITHQYNLDTLTMWLKNMPCVEDAEWDKCQEKLLGYPGSAAVGAKFKTNNGIIEKCFLIQEGTTGNVNIFGWRAHVFKTRNILVYKKMFDCKGFVELQKKNCLELMPGKPVVQEDTSRINVQKLIGFWEPVDSTMGKIEFIDKNKFQFVLKADSFSTYSFDKDSLNTIPATGLIFLWPPYSCYIKFIEDNLIEVSYGNAVGGIFAVIRYRRFSK